MSVPGNGDRLAVPCLLDGCPLQRSGRVDSHEPGGYLAVSLCAEHAPLLFGVPDLLRRTVAGWGGEVQLATEQAIKWSRPVPSMQRERAAAAALLGVSTCELAPGLADLHDVLLRTRAARGLLIGAGELPLFAVSVSAFTYASVVREVAAALSATSGGQLTAGGLGAVHLAHDGVRFDAGVLIRVSLFLECDEVNWPGQRQLTTEVVCPELTRGWTAAQRDTYLLLRAEGHRPRQAWELTGALS